MIRRTLEIAVVMCLLIWVGCGTATRETAKMEKTTSVPPNAEKYPAGAEELKSLFPESIGDTGWRRDTVIVYDEKTIFDHINGAAEAFFKFGFQLCGTAEYIPDKGGTGEFSQDEFILVDIYDMGKPIQAFGMYASELYPESEFVDVGVQGYVETPILNFWKGRYYVKIMAASMDENVNKINMELAKHIARNIPGEAEEPEMLSLLPDEGFIPNSEKFILKNILGYSFLKNGVMGNYRTGDEEKSLLIMEYESGNEAGSLLSQFTRYEEKTGQDIETITDPGEGGFIAEDKNYRRLMAVRQGKHVLVVFPVTDESASRQLIRLALEKINGQN